MLERMVAELEAENRSKRGVLTAGSISNPLARHLKTTIAALAAAAAISGGETFFVTIAADNAEDVKKGSERLSRALSYERLDAKWLPESLVPPSMYLEEALVGYQVMPKSVERARRTVKVDQVIHAKLVESETGKPATLTIVKRFEVNVDTGQIERETPAAVVMATVVEPVGENSLRDARQDPKVSEAADVLQSLGESARIRYHTVVVGCGRLGLVTSYYQSRLLADNARFAIIATLGSDCERSNFAGIEEVLQDIASRPARKILFLLQGQQAANNVIPVFRYLNDEELITLVAMLSATGKGTYGEERNFNLANYQGNLGSLESWQWGIGIIFTSAAWLRYDFRVITAQSKSGEAGEEGGKEGNKGREVRHGHRREKPTRGGKEVKDKEKKEEDEEGEKPAWLRGVKRCIGCFACVADGRRIGCPARDVDAFCLLELEERTFPRHNIILTTARLPSWASRGASIDLQSGAYTWFNPVPLTIMMRPVSLRIFRAAFHAVTGYDPML